MDLGIEGIDDVEPIARGGTAAVYRARQPRLGRTVAVKVIDNGAGDKVIRRFEREARALGTLSEHAGIVTVYEVGTTTAGLPYLLMQYCPGGSLQDVIGSGDSMPPARARELIAQVASTLAVAHERGVFHHDLKPANLLIDRQGRAVVADFGIAALTHTDNGVTSAILFTPGFAAPECLKGEPPTAESDVYSLGATLYALVTGEVPFTGEASQDGGYAVAIRAMSEDLPSTRPLGVPDDIASVIERATSRNPAERPTMNDIAHMLRGGHIGSPTQSEPLRQSPTRPTQRPVAATSAPTTSLPRPVQVPPTSTAAGGSSRRAIGASALALVMLIAAALWVYSATRDQTPSSTTASPGADSQSGDNPQGDLLASTSGDVDSSNPDSAGADASGPDAMALDPTGLCESGSTLIHGGESYGAPEPDGDVRVAICLQPAGALEYFGLETGPNLSIRLPACEEAPGRFVADNAGSVYTVTNDLASATPSVSLVSAGTEQFDYVFDIVFVGEGATDLTPPSC